MAKPNFYSIINDGSDVCLFYWQEFQGANHYYVEGLSPNFLYEVIGESETTSYSVPIDVCKKYIAFRLKCFRIDVQNPDNCAILGISAPIKVEKRNKDIETISVFALKSFSGIALSFQTDEELDEYQLFAVKDGRKKLLCSTNVPVLNSKEICENEKYYVEGFDTKDGNITLCAKSEIFLCNPLLEQPSTTSPFLSIIIPVYNCEEFIARTIDSVLLSTYKDTEIILVDDGSTDKSPEICDWYAEKYAKIKCLHIAHGDVCKARNTGLNESAGEFVAFVDADDLVHPLMYQRLVKAALDNNSDIAIGQTYTLRYNKETKLFERGKCMFIREPYLSMQNVFVESYNKILQNKGEPDGLYFDSPCNKIIRRNVAKKAHFIEECVMYEDYSYTMSVYSYIDNFVFVKNAVYLWDCRKRMTSGTKSTANNVEYYAAWKMWLLSRFNVLLQGNPRPFVAKIYQECVIFHIFSKFLNTSQQSSLDRLFIAMVKYYTRIADVDMEELQNHPDRTLYPKWLTIKNSPIGEFDGRGEIPKEIRN
ncbi:MAG: glycosyltransferase family 2 protein [Phascolarctobacterium sp.]|nr:glycosyltransferase family 2 protein [Phascolarctobacterium sp.]